MIVAFSSETEGLRLIRPILLTDGRKLLEGFLESRLIRLPGALSVFRDALDHLSRILELLLGLLIVKKNRTYVPVEVIQVAHLTLLSNFQFLLPTSLVHIIFLYLNP